MDFIESEGAVSDGPTPARLAVSGSGRPLRVKRAAKTRETSGQFRRIQVANSREIRWRKPVKSAIDHILPAIRVEMVEQSVHEVALAEYRAVAGGTSFVDRVTIAFGKRHGIGVCFAFDADLKAAGLAPLG
jgi:hypothetical protein